MTGRGERDQNQLVPVSGNPDGGPPPPAPGERETAGSAAGGGPGTGGRHAGWWRLGAVSAATAGLLWAASAADGGVRLPGAALTAETPEEVVPAPPAFVESATLVCAGPDLPGEDGTGEGSETALAVAAALAPREVGEDDRELPDGHAVLGATGSGEEIDIPDGGVAQRLLDAPVSPVLDAEGASAAGLVGGQLGVSTEPGTRGLAIVPCTAPGETQWLVGGGGQPGRSEHLVLTNPGSDPVTVDVSVFGADGPATTTGAAGRVVPPGGRSVLLLDALARGVESPALLVESSGGPVVAQLGEHFRDGTTDLGADVVQPAAVPATDLVVPAMLPGSVGPGGAGPGSAGPGGLDAGDDLQLTLRIVAPGEAAIVELTALTETGAVRPAVDVRRVAAGHTVDISLEDLPEDAAALRLRSDAPITAGARVEALPSTDDPILPGEHEVDGTTVPDQVAGTADPDGAASTARPGPDVPEEPLVRPAGDLAWVAATTVSRAPVGIAIPDRAAVPGARGTLAVTAVDGTAATVFIVDEDAGLDTERIERIGNDTTVVLELPEHARAVWVRPDGQAGVVASVRVTGRDPVGPYLTAATLPATPWQRALTQISVVNP